MSQVPAGETTRPPARAPAAVFAEVLERASFSPLAGRLLQAPMESPETGDTVRELVQSDPSLASQVLRRLNSPYFGFSHRVLDIESAVGLLGAREIRNLALTVHLCRLLDQPGKFGIYQRSGLLNHCVGVATAAHLIARVCACGRPTDAYLAGLFHDLGWIVMDRHLRGPLRQLVNALDRQLPTLQLEQQLQGFNHAELGAHVAAAWGFPPPLVDAARHHHAAERYAGPHQELVFVVTVANYLCSRAQVTALGLHNLPPPPDCVFAGLELDDLALAVIWEELRGTLDRIHLLTAA